MLVACLAGHMERPNIVHGLIAKLRYLFAIDCDPADIAAIDRVLALFGTAGDKIWLLVVVAKVCFRANCAAIPPAIFWSVADKKSLFCKLKLVPLYPLGRPGAHQITRIQCLGGVVTSLCAQLRQL
jgi:hypothetical protein